MAHALNPSTGDTQGHKSLWVEVQPCLHSEFQSSHSYIVRLSHKRNETKQNKTVGGNSLPHAGFNKLMLPPSSFMWYFKSLSEGTSVMFSNSKGVSKEIS